jgi:predicted metal-dependent phosphoesterase TrpH
MPVPSAAAVQRHPHLADEVPDGWVRVDLHTHSMWSGDCTTTPDELAEGVAASGIDVLCLTDHGTINGAVELADRLPCRVIVGQEVRTRWGEIIGLFVTERIPTGRPPVEVAEAIRDQGGLVYIPHPFDPLRANLAEGALVDLLERGLVDAMEGRNAKTSLEHLNRRAQDVAVEHRVAVGAGSDAHVPDAIGAAYAEVPDFRDAAGLLAGLRTGRLRGHHWDEPRPWRPRIVPSTSAL